MHQSHAVVSRRWAQLVAALRKKDRRSPSLTHDRRDRFWHTVSQSLRIMSAISKRRALSWSILLRDFFAYEEYGGQKEYDRLSDRKSGTYDPFSITVFRTSILVFSRCAFPTCRMSTLGNREIRRQEHCKALFSNDAWQSSTRSSCE